MSPAQSEQDRLNELKRIKAEKAEARRLAAEKEAEEEAALEAQIAEAERLEAERKAEEEKKAAEAARLEAERKAAEALKAEEDRKREEAIEAARKLAEATRIQFDGAGERSILEKVYGPVARLPDGLLTMPPEKVGPVSVSFPGFWSYVMDRQHADEVEKKYKGRKTGPKSKAVVEDSGDAGSVKVSTPTITSDGLYEPGEFNLRRPIIGVNTYFLLACPQCVQAKRKECRVPMR